MFIEEDGTSINNKDRKEFQIGKMLKYTNFLTFKELYEKSVSLNIAAKAFVA